MPEIQIEAAEIKERKADDRGRVNLGADYADAQVRVAVVEVVGDDHAETEQ